MKMFYSMVNLVELLVINDGIFFVNFSFRRVG